MSTNRTTRNAYVAPSRLPKGPNGRACCRQCGTEVPKGRRTFCSQACVDEWRIRSDPGYARSLVFRRDRGVCALCSLDTEPLSSPRHRRYYQQFQYSPFEDRWSQPWADHADFTAAQTAHIQYHEHVRRKRQFELGEQMRLDSHKSHLLELGFTHAGMRGSLWEMDHIVPVVEGGGECGLDNLRTLCVPCHRRVTAELAARRAEQRRAEKEAALQVELADLTRLPLFGGLEGDRAQPA